MPRSVALATCTAASLLGFFAVASAPASRDAELAAALRGLYDGPPAAHERWGAGPPLVTLPDGSRVPRDRAWRDHPEFEAAATRLLRAPGDAALGAWLLRARPGPLAAGNRRALQAVLDGQDGLAASEAARTLATRGGRAALADLERVASEARAPLVRAAADWAAAETRGAPPPARSGAPFGRGVAWWYEAQDGDHGAGSFTRLRRLGVDTVSLHTWDPLQVAARRPEFAEARRRFAPRDLAATVSAAHAAGLQVLVKPHLEMARLPLSDAERAALRGTDRAAREAAMAALRERRRLQGWHGEIEMQDDADWRRWFERYADYLLAHAREARAAGADAFCVGRELDRTVLAREADWRRLIARVRVVFPGPLTYSAHHDTFDRLGFWDALDFAGVAAYFPIALGAQQQPTDAELAAGWRPVQARLSRFARRLGRPVVATEVGYPAIPGAAARPWEERDEPADPWLQARLLDAALGALSRTDGVTGAHVWLWEGVGSPPFRDPSFTVNGKPAEFALARWFGGFGR
ncbi:MAG: hypothetical protein KJ067_04910 [Vicinamibacteria bacterium]|nr:hypothetical protein [Vicinamibacteria bacterium]